MGDTTTISINKKTRELLKMFGRKGETYDEIITKLIDASKIVEFHERQDYILKHEKFKRLED